MAKVFLDAGHGGRDPGAGGNGIQEKNITLPVTLKIGDILKNHDVNVGYSRTTDIFVELEDRASLANNFGANVFVSIHCNAFTDSSAKGMETYSYPGSTSGGKLSKDVHDSIISEGVYTVDRGMKTANFAVLRLTNMPAALIETAFITNAQDANILKNRQDELALAIAKGILKNLGIPYRGTTLYKVQVGAFAIKSNADNLAAELQEKGYDAIVVYVGGLYKVQVGAFNIRENADNLAAELRSKGYDAIVVS